MAESFIGQADLPIGLRNNNPGDFRTGIAWQGAIGQEDGFITFRDISWGLRALALDLINNIGAEGYDTIRLFITKFAPPSENDTDDYITSVSADTGLDPDVQLGTDQDTLHSLMRAIINKEIGDGYSSQVTDADIDNGITMAGSPLSTLPQAAIIAAQANPVVTLILLLSAAWVGYSLYQDRPGSKH